MLTNGSAKLNSATLNERSLFPFEGNMPPTTPATVTRLFTINQTDILTWVVDGDPYSEPKTPIIYGNVSDAWNANTTLKMPLNSTIDLILRIANDSMDTVSFALCFSLQATSPPLMHPTCATPFRANGTKTN